ncbi:MAG: DUF3775 domain-containing protein [Alphaproteobacteria bacterium]|nr:DUF3775 domain-containing protein [Alphaproteobacteria bacterium]
MADPDTDEDAPLAVSPETVTFIVLTARAFSAKEEVTDPGAASNALDDHAIGTLEHRRSDPTAEELMGAVNALTETGQRDLLALLWLGRGDFEPSEWDAARTAAAEVRDLHVARYLIETPLAGDHLAEGLSLLGYGTSEDQLARP